MKILSNFLSTFIVEIGVEGGELLNLRKSSLILTALAAVVLVSGCFNKKSTVEKMYDVLESVVSSEKVFEEQQDPLVLLEKKEKALYDQIIGLGMKQYDQIVKLSDEALKLTDERKDRMEKETKSINKSKQKFNEVANLKENLDKPELRKTANELYDTMIKRYQAHDELYKEYMEGIKADQELYQMFKNKNLPLSALEDQVTKLNNIYEKIYAVNENFNKLTEEYNAKKMTFYKEAGFKSE
jgi:hypothetical protein